jgi:hypothetical protein
MRVISRRQIVTHVAIAATAASIAAAGVALANGDGATGGAGAPPDQAKAAQKVAAVGGPAPDVVVAAIRSGLDPLVAQGPITQDQEATVLEAVRSGRVETARLVGSGVVTAGQMDAIDRVLRQVKQSVATR